MTSVLVLKADAREELRDSPLLPSKSLGVGWGAGDVEVRIGPHGPSGDRRSMPRLGPVA